MAALCVGEMPNNRYIPRCPNGETPLFFGSDVRMHERTLGSETSQYLEEKKAKNGTFFLVGSVARLAITIRKKVLAIP